MEQPDAPSNGRRNDSNGNIYNNRISVDRNCENTTSTVDDAVKVLYLGAECPELRIEPPDFSKCFVARCRNVQRVCVSKLSDIKIDKGGPICCDKMCSEGFPDVTLDTTGA